MADALKKKGYAYQFVFSEAAGHVDRRVQLQTMPEAFEWVWKGFKPMTLDRRAFTKSVAGALGFLAPSSGRLGAAPRADAGARSGSRRRAALTDEDHEDPRLLSAQLQRERPAGVSAEQHGGARRYRRRDHGHRSGRVARHGPQRREKRDRQERLRHRVHLAGRVHGRVLFARQGTAPCARRHRSGPVGHQGQGLERPALSTVRRQGARAHRAVRHVRFAARDRPAG